MDKAGCRLGSRQTHLLDAAIPVQMLPARYLLGEMNHETSRRGRKQMGLWMRVGHTQSGEGRPSWEKTELPPREEGIRPQAHSIEILPKSLAFRVKATNITASLTLQPAGLTSRPLQGREEHSLNK